MARLRKLGIQSMMLTGDAKEMAAWVAEELAPTRMVRSDSGEPSSVFSGGAGNGMLR